MENELVKLLFWIILSYGLATIIVYGKIFENVRLIIEELSKKIKIFKFIHELISCMLCFSVWSGFFLSLTIYSPSNMLYGTNPLYSWFFDGLFSGGAVWITNTFVEFFEENRINLKNT